MSYKLFRTPDKGETIVIFVDPAEGGDYSAMSAMSKKHHDVFMSFHSKTAESKVEVGSTQLGNEASKMGLYIKSKTGFYPHIAVEKNTGLATIAKLLDLEYPRIWKMKTFDLQEQKEKTEFGWHTNKRTREKMLSDWAEALLKRQVVIYDKATLQEHLSFIRPEKNPTHPEAIAGKNDDRVFACSGAWQVVQLVPFESSKKLRKPTQMWDSRFGRVYR